MPHPLFLSLLLCSGLLAVGLLLRVKLHVLRVLYIPASVVAGLLGFGLLQAGLASVHTHAVADAFFGEMKGWPGWLIAVIFAGLLLERPSAKTIGESLRRGARSAIVAWMLILGQILIGLVVFVAVVHHAHPDVPASFGQLLEVSWAGGHGTSAAMAQIYASQGFAQGRDLAFFLATLGLIYGVISGLVLVNLALRRGWAASTRNGGSTTIPIVTGLEPRQNPQPIGLGHTRREVLDPLALQVLILAAAIAAGYIMQQLFIYGATFVLGPGDPAVGGEAIDFLDNIPLFLFTLLGGWVVRTAMVVAGIGDLIDSGSIQRLLGVAMEFLIVAAVATMRLDALSAYFVPVLLLFVGSALWTAFCLLVVSRAILPRAYWFELGLLNYGFATANTPQGLMLLRIIDPDLATGAAEDYAVAAPLSAPFVGGGVLTVAVFPFVLAWTWWSMALLLLALIALYTLGHLTRERP